MKENSAQEVRMRRLKPAIGRFSDLMLTGLGNDRYLYVWNSDGEQQGRIERQEEENLNCLLYLGNEMVVTGSNSCLLRNALLANH